MCTVLLPPSDNPIAFNKYIISYQNFDRKMGVLIVKIHKSHY